MLQDQQSYFKKFVHYVADIISPSKKEQTKIVEVPDEDPSSEEEVKEETKALKFEVYVDNQKVTKMRDIVVVAGSMALSVFGIHALSILTVRMQNIDYSNNRNFRGAIKDLLTIDKHRCLYRGFVPISIAFMNLRLATDLMHVFRTPELSYSHYLWPFVFLGGTLIAHPFMVIGMRVMYGPLNRTATLRKANQNLFYASAYIQRTKGLKGFYAGFAPGLLIYMALSYDSIKRAVIDTVHSAAHVRNYNHE